jgi:hypothetical protein
MITKALPDWTVPETFLRLIWLAATSHAGVLDWAVQPLVSCPMGPLTYPGVILTGADRAALTSSGFVDWQVVVAVLWSAVHLRATELFPTAENDSLGGSKH